MNNKFVEAVKSTQRTVKNFMGGTSYEINPLDTLKMLTASSIFGEPQYYRDGEFTDGVCIAHSLFLTYNIFGDNFNQKRTSDLMEEVIDAALDFNFEQTIRWAVVLRNEYFMRLNPQIIMVRAAIHPKRKEFTNSNPKLFSEINHSVMRRADEPSAQLTYYLYKNGKKNNTPAILKRSWARRIESMGRYDIAKYKNYDIGLIDTIRICHAKGILVDELMRTGKVSISDDESAWEKLRSSGKPWPEIVSTIRLPHMALLRNLRGIFSEIDEPSLAKSLIEQLKGGVAKGMQFPFRYMSALKAIDEDNRVKHKPSLIDGLEECMDISTANLPRLKGKTMCLSDNSGSAWGIFSSEYGSVTVANIDNLSSVITAYNSDEGYVGKFGDSLKIYPISQRNGVLAQAEKIDEKRGEDVGLSTENGIWIFFRDAINKKEHWDNIFIYSDQQAGHGELYGTDVGISEYRQMGFAANSECIDVAKLIAKYRRLVNPNVNVFSVQTAGYTNVVIPEYGFRTNIMYGWTGKELIFADAMIRFWNSKQ